MGIIIKLRIDKLLIQSQRVTVLSFANPTVTVPSTYLHSYSKKAAIDNVSMNEHGLVPIKLYLQKRPVATLGSTKVGQPLT